MKCLSILAIILILLTLLQTQSRAVLAAILISIFAFIFMYRKNLRLKNMFVIFFSFVLFIVLCYSIVKYTDRLEAFNLEIRKTFDFKDSPRFKLYKSTLQLFVDQPILGVGPGNWKIDVWKYGLYINSLGRSFAQRPHNDFLWVLAEGGIFAGLSYMLLFLILL